MAATFEWQEDNGTAAGAPPKGTSRTANRTEVNWKNVDDSTTAYSSSPITAGNNSYHKFQFGVFSGTFNQITNGKFNQTSGILGAGLFLYNKIGTVYSTPSTTASGAWQPLSSGSITTGYTVLFGITGPEAAGKAASSTTVPSFSEYIATQLQTTVAASAGDTSTIGLTLRYEEN